MPQPSKQDAAYTPLVWALLPDGIKEPIRTDKGVKMSWDRIFERNFCDGTSAYRIKYPEGATVADLIAHALSQQKEHGSIAIVRPHSWLGLVVEARLKYAYGKIKADNIPEESKAAKLKSVVGFGGYSLMDYNITI